jgi:hypothetical protein
MRKLTPNEFKAMTLRLHTDELLTVPQLIKNIDLNLGQLKAYAKFYIDSIPSLKDKTPKELKIIQDYVLGARFCLLFLYALLEEERYDLEVILPDIQKKIKEAGNNEEVKPG